MGCFLHSNKVLFFFSPKVLLQRALLCHDFRPQVAPYPLKLDQSPPEGLPLLAPAPGITFQCQETRRSTLLAASGQVFFPLGKPAYKMKFNKTVLKNYHFLLALPPHPYPPKQPHSESFFWDFPSRLLQESAWGQSCETRTHRAVEVTFSQ